MAMSSNVRRGISVLVGLSLGIGMAVAFGRIDSNSGSSSNDTIAVLDLDATGTADQQDAGIDTNSDVRGQPLPDTTLVDVNGERRSVSSIANAAAGTPLVVNAWFSSCVPCAKELPAFAEVSADYAGTVTFVGVNPLPASDTEESFARDLGVTYDLLYDRNGDFTTAVGIARWPISLFVSADGTIVHQTGELTADELRAAIEEHLL
jgi:thiol-disulfide isomerase/thioredoxin